MARKGSSQVSGFSGRTIGKMLKKRPVGDLLPRKKRP